MANNPNTAESQQKRGRYRKIVLINKSGGGCEICGYNKNIAALDFHHINKEEKNFSLDMRHLSNNSWDRILKEFKKCKCLCSNCHREIHYPERSINKIRKNLDESYNPQKSTENRCKDCNQIISSRATRCRDCNSKNREKINWPPTDWIKRIVKEYSYLHLSRKLDVSNNAIKKRIKNH